MVILICSEQFVKIFTSYRKITSRVLCGTLWLTQVCLITLLTFLIIARQWVQAQTIWQLLPHSVSEGWYLAIDMFGWTCRGSICECRVIWLQMAIKLSVLLQHNICDYMCFTLHWSGSWSHTQSEQIIGAALRAIKIRTIIRRFLCCGPSLFVAGCYKWTGLSCHCLFPASFASWKIRLYYFDPLKLHFYIVKPGFTGVYIFFLILLKKQQHRLWVLLGEEVSASTTIYVLSRDMKNIRVFIWKLSVLWWNFQCILKGKRNAG